jgi:hypothetical protein
VSAVYLLVELRKVLDHVYSGRKQEKFLLLRFYCDWIVHTDKSRHLEHIAPIIKKAYDDVKMRIEQGPYAVPGKDAILEFIYMDGLKAEMEEFFTIEQLPLQMFQPGPWATFVSAIVQILVDQPILNPVPEVPRLVLTPANPRCICGIMEFAHLITGHDGKQYAHYDFKNVY